MSGMDRKKNKGQPAKTGDFVLARGSYCMKNSYRGPQMTF
jgi:hypothetical protein